MLKVVVADVICTREGRIRFVHADVFDGETFLARRWIAACELPRLTGRSEPPQAGDTYDVALTFRSLTPSEA